MFGEYAKRGDEGGKYMSNPEVLGGAAGAAVAAAIVGQRYH